MLFSVVIPTHNRLDLLLETICSVQAQSFRDFEIIVVDDCSKVDPTPEVSRLFPTVRVIRQAKNQGVGAARNAGIEAAKCEYVAFLDDDDLWMPWTLETQAGAIQRHNRPAIVSVNGQVLTGRRDRWDVPRDPVREKCFADYLAYVTNPHQPGWLITSGMAIRRDVLTAVTGFDPGMSYHEDEDMWMQLGTAPGFVRVASPKCWLYRSHTQMSSNLSRRFRPLHAMIERERSGRYPGGPERARDRVAVIAQLSRHLTRRGARQGFTREAAALYRDILAWNLDLRRWRFLLLAPLEMLAGSWRKAA